MKKLLQLTIACLLLNSFSTKSSAQQKLIHYWHFNNLVNFTTVQISPSTFPSVKANYSSLDTNKALIAYRPLAGTAGNALTFWDNVSPGDTVNARMGAPAGLGFRPRNPSDSMQLLFYIPSTFYKNISVKFETQKSSAGNGAATDSMDYSIDSGITWKNSGITPLVASNGTGAWSSSVIYAVISDTLAFNNNKLVFRMRFIAPGNSGTSGNIRIDNVTVEGDTIQTPKLIHYWHFNNLANFTTVQVSPSIFPAVKANYSTLDTNKAVIAYKPLSGTVGNQLTFWDNVSPGDTVNARMGQPAGLGFRPRNPGDSMQLMVYIPTTGYKNIVIKYETQKSSAGNGAATDSMDYSLDSGITWKNTGITPLIASNGTGAWSAPGSPIIATLTNFQSWNNSKLVFRIRFNAPGNAGTSGNVRIDNLTIEGDTFIGTYPLPVKLLSFNAHVTTGNNVLITWQTASEIDNDHFTVERSFDLSKWEEFATVKATGNSNVITSYQAADEIENAPLVYYRLRQFDHNGALAMFGPVAVTFKNNLPNIISIENPVKDNHCKIKMLSGNQTDLLVTIRNMLGIVVQTSPQVIYKGNNDLDIDVTGLSSGLYFVEIKIENTILTIKKIVK